MYITDSLIKFWFNVNHFQTINSILLYTIYSIHYTYYITVVVLNRIFYTHNTKTRI